MKPVTKSAETSLNDLEVPSACELQPESLGEHPEDEPEADDDDDDGGEISTPETPVPPEPPGECPEDEPPEGASVIHAETKIRPSVRNVQ